MKKANQIILTILLGFINFSFGQDKFSNCSAAFLNDKMIVEEYSNTAKAKISIEAKGWLSAGTVSLGDTQKGEVAMTITEKFNFGVAIKDGNSGTMMLYSASTFKKVEIEKVLAKCKKGDYIVILTTDDQYALPHNEILVQ